MKPSPLRIARPIEHLQRDKVLLPEDLVQSPTRAEMMQYEASHMSTPPAGPVRRTTVETPFPE